MPNTRSTIWVAIALLAGLAVGWLDVSASEVQGPLLLLMLAAFAIAFLSRTPAWLVALAVTLGLPLAHLIHGSGDAQWGMLIALVPTLIASYSAKGVVALIGATSSTLVSPEQRTDNPEAWYERPASTPSLLGAALLGCALVGAVPVYATNAARGQPFTWWLTIIWQILSFLAWVIVAPLVLRTWRHSRRNGIRAVTPSEIATHAAVVVGIAFMHAAALPLVTRLLFIPLGPDGIPAAMQWAFAAYLPLDALTYCLVIMLAHASDANAIARAAAERESAVRGELATSQLATLRAQLRPHFLFNALNAATVLTRRGDVESAARVLSRLAELLRYVLRGAEGDTTVGDDGMARLGDELDFADSYLAIERERFPDRLHVETEITADARAALVPHLLLQPLVENAVQHGIGAHIGSGTVTIRAWRIAEALHVSVENDGPQTTMPADTSNGRTTHGIGLANTRARLSTIYGSKAQLELSARPEGGVAARIILPYRT
jgi:two-component system LytT family sensor kinase